MAIIHNTSVSTPIPDGSKNSKTTKKSRSSRLPPIGSPGILSPVPLPSTKDTTNKWRVGIRTICDKSATLPISPVVSSKTQAYDDANNNSSNSDQLVMITSLSGSFSSLSSDGEKFNNNKNTKDHHNHIHQKEKKVTFSTSVRMRHLSKRDSFFYASVVANNNKIGNTSSKNPIWYTQEEIDDQKEEDSIIIQLMNHRDQRQSKEGEGEGEEDVGVVLQQQQQQRGLERRTKKGIQRSKRTRVVAMNAVLKEQQRQKRMYEKSTAEVGNGSSRSSSSSSRITIEYDTHAIARAYTLFTKPAQQVAYQTGLKDEQDCCTQ